MTFHLSKLLKGRLVTAIKEYEGTNLEIRQHIVIRFMILMLQSSYNEGFTKVLYLWEV